MPQDAYTLKYVARDLGALLPGGKVTKISQPDRDTLHLYIYPLFGGFKLEICIFPKFRRISLTKRDSKSLETPSSFLMLIRKHLQGAKILSCGQVPYERIMYFDFESVSEFDTRTFRLYAEIMGKSSNIILTENGKILGCMKPGYAGEGVRNTLTGADYTLPLSQHKVLPDDLEGIRRALAEAGPDALHESITGIAHVTAEDIISAYGEDVSAEQVYEYLNSDDIRPCVILEGSKVTDFCARSSSPLAVPRDSILAAQAEFYDSATQEASLQSRKAGYNASLTAALKKAEKKIATERQRILSCENMEQDRLYGELITANMYRVRPGDELLIADNYYSPSLEQCRIPLDKQLSPSQNAQRYYKRYNKQKRTVEVSERLLGEALAREDYLLSVQTAIRRAQDTEDLAEIAAEMRESGLLKDTTPKQRKKKTVSRPYRMYTCQGYEILAGRNNMSNDALLHALSGDDIWLHTKEGHSCHVGIICGTQSSSVPEDVILIGAQICAFYSDLTGKGKVEVCFTRRRSVRKPKGAAPGFVTYTDYKSMMVSPDPHAELKHE
ncbi:MAG: NFACT family protein [Clostridia bacterium]|nr:NFACT family protein [Clostridia bacterium]